MSTNRAWTIPPPSTTTSTHPNLIALTQTTLPVPTPGPHQILIRLSAASLNARDLLIIAHSPAYIIRASPYLVPCSDGSGTITAVGTSSRWQPGDRVLLHPNTWFTGDVRNMELDKAFGGGEVHGTLQQWMVVDDEQVVRAPRNLELEEAAALVTAGATAVNAFFFGPTKVRRGDVVLTQGTGGVSCFAIQLATAIGATVIATSSSDEKLKVAKRLGAKHLINYKTTPDWDDEVLRITGGKGVDHVVEVGGSQTIVKSIRSLRPGGLVTIIGILSHGPSADLVPLLLFGGKTARGSLAASREMVEELVRLVEEHDIHPVISKSFDFDHALEALECLKGQSNVGKIIVRIAD